MFLVPPLPTSTIVTSLFGAQESGLRTSPHRGVDFAVPVGTEIKSPASGVVKRVFVDDGGGGLVVDIEHPALGVRSVIDSRRMSPV
jgi:murein DD-endopeptidase MepM/ murein hydrolase activator NlpD